MFTSHDSIIIYTSLLFSFVTFCLLSSLAISVFPLPVLLLVKNFAFFLLCAMCDLIGRKKMTFFASLLGYEGGFKREKNGKVLRDV